MHVDALGLPRANGQALRMALLPEPLQTCPAASLRLNAGAVLHRDAYLRGSRRAGSHPLHRIKIASWQVLARGEDASVRGGDETPCSACCGHARKNAEECQVRVIRTDQY